MRDFNDLEEAVSEIGRDVYKGPRIVSTRVQQRVDQSLVGREKFGYTYTIRDTSNPSNIEGFLEFCIEKIHGPMFSNQNRIPLQVWLEYESKLRLGKLDVNEYYNTHNDFIEQLHPALNSAIEGSAPSYTYGERLDRAIPYIVEELFAHPDSRRAYWPIFSLQDARRMSLPTRIPCSLGYQLMLRNVGEETKLLMFYYERSCDFDSFWITDVFLAFLFQREVLHLLNVKRRLDGQPEVQLGSFIHFIASLHSFLIEGMEIY